MQRIAMDVIGEGSLNRHSEGPRMEHVYSTLHDFVFKQPQMYNMDMAAEKVELLNGGCGSPFTMQLYTQPNLSFLQHAFSAF
jgi:hypothetical protein